MRKDQKERHSPRVVLCRGGQRLDSWKAIANYLNRTARTAQRWEKQEGLPVHRHQHDKQGSVFAYSDELDAWIVERSSKPRGRRSWWTYAAVRYAAAAVVVIATATYWWHETTSVDHAAATSDRAAQAPPPPPVSFVTLPDPASPEAYQRFVIGMDHLGRRNVEAAIAAFELATSLDEDFTRAHGALALARSLQTGRVMDRVTYAEARREAQAALRADPTLPEAHTALGVLALEQGRVSDAEASLRTAIELDPDLGEARYWLVLSLDDQGRYAEADIELRAALATDPLHPLINDALATRYRARGDYEQARQRYLAMLELEAPPIDSYHGLIELNTEYGRLDRALYWARQIALRKPVYNGLQALISAYTRLEMYREADRWRARLANVEPEDAPRLGANCKYLYMRQRIEECYALKEEYLARSPEMSVDRLPFAVQETHGGMAVITGRYEEGISVLEQLFRPRLRIPEHLGGSDMALMFAQMLAYAYQQTGRGMDAEALLEEIDAYLETLRVRSRGARPAIMIAEARNHALLGREDQALASLRQAVEAGWRDYVYERPHPAWTSLRDDPEYQALMTSVEQDVAGQRLELQSRGPDPEFEAAVLEAIERALPAGRER